MDSHRAFNSSSTADLCDGETPLRAVTCETSYELVSADPAASAALMFTNKTTKLCRVTKMTTRRCVAGQPDHAYTNKSFSASPYSSPMPSSDYPANGSQADCSNHNYNDYNDYLCSYALPSAPGAPHILSYDDRSVSLSWTPPDRTGDRGYIDGYQVHYRNMLEPEQWHPVFDHLVVGTECTVTNLQPGRQYVFCVVAKSATGFGQPSTLSPVVQLKDVPMSRRNSSMVPSAPEALRLLAGDVGAGVTLAWDPPAFCGSGGSLTGYEVQCRTEEGSSWVTIGHSVVPMYRLCGLQDNRTYEFRIVARNACGSSPPSRSVMYDQVVDGCQDSINAVGTLPGPPTDLRIGNVDSSSCTLSWSPPMHSVGAMRYLVQFREIGDPKWRNAVEVPIADTELTVINLRPNSTYEFRIFSHSPAGLSNLCLVSDILQLRPALLSNVDYLKSIPDRPSTPKVIEIRGNSVVLSWPPMNGVQGYQLEFCDVTLAPGVWNTLNQILTLANRMNVNDLVAGHEYSFRVIAKNAIGYSESSEPSRPIRVRSALSPGDVVPLPVEMREAKESPPITDTDESPPPLRRTVGQWPSGLQYRDPTLSEVVEYLDNANTLIQLNAAGYLQHLTFNDDNVKQKVRLLGGIHKLVPLLASDVPEIQKNAAGCLRNLAYGNEDNKRVIHQAGGLVTLVELLKRTPEVLIVEEVTGTLWNMSSCHDLKTAIFELCADHLVQQIVVPHCKLATASTSTHVAHPAVQPPLIFRNATGILLNVSSAGDAIRRALRDKDGLVEQLVAYLHSASARHDVDSKIVENVICLTRNLSYRLQEVENGKLSKGGGGSQQRERSKSAPSESPKGSLKKSLRRRPDAEDRLSNTLDRLPEFRGVAPLLKLDTVRLCMALLQNSTNPDVLEASAGAIQNLCACDWQPSEAVRVWVRKEKGLPIFVELLRTDAEKVKRAAACALRNLAMDARNRDLIGKYAMTELVALLPYGPPSDGGCSEDLIVAALSLIYSTTSANADFAKTLMERGGAPRLLHLAKGSHGLSSRVRVYARQVLKAIWLHKDLQDVFRRAGVKEDDFLTYPGRPTGSVSTLARPLSASGMDSHYPNSSTSRLYEGSVGSGGYDDIMLRTQLDRMQIADRNSQGTSSFDRTPPPYCSSPRYPMSDPLYAQVQKMNRGKPVSLNSSYASNLHQPAGDSWV